MIIRQIIGLEGSCLQNRYVGHSSSTDLIESIFCSLICTFFHASLITSYPDCHGTEMRITLLSLLGTSCVFQDLFNVSASQPLNGPKCPNWDIIHGEQGSKETSGPYRPIAKVTLTISLVWYAELMCLGERWWSQAGSVTYSVVCVL